MAIPLNMLGALLLQAQPTQARTATNTQLPIPGLNMLPKVGFPAVQQGGRLQTRLPMPIPAFPSKTRGEAATAVRPDIGTLLGEGG